MACCRTVAPQARAGCWQLVAGAPGPSAEHAPGSAVAAGCWPLCAPVAGRLFFVLSTAQMIGLPDRFTGTFMCHCVSAVATEIWPLCISLWQAGFFASCRLLLAVALWSPVTSLLRRGRFSALKAWPVLGLCAMEFVCMYVYI